MKRLLLALVLFTACAVQAQPLDLEALLGESWYGLYMNGQKAGFARNSAERTDAGTIRIVEDAQFRISMAGMHQEMKIYTQRDYTLEGDLIVIESHVDDFSGKTSFSAIVNGDKMELTSQVGGKTETVTLPKPAESLRDAVKHAQWVQQKPVIGDAMTFSAFEPMYRKEIQGTSTLLSVEERIFEGVLTKVYKIETNLDLIGVHSIAYVAEDGTTLEDVVSGLITMRLEPEAMAKDVNYNNDVIISNAALVEEPIEDARIRKALGLIVEGPLSEDHLFNDDRQSFTKEGETYLFSSQLQAVDEKDAATLPITNPEVTQHIQATAFVQSSDPKIIEKAREIAGDETNAKTVSDKLCDWVHKNMRSTFSARLTNTLEVLDSMAGDCTEHSMLFIGLARAAGLPAREVAGLIYVESEPTGFYFHQWAKVWVGQWIDVDPTFNQTIADVTHIKLAEGDLFEQAKLIPVIGKLKIKVAPKAP
ncbi:MAG: transglutaminase domain-containing protein [Candidatus Hydrogenedentes bacterium]|nr:transglutaminase domain-containing protein [Candidatus Hydrogenedentota bacterium]